MPQAETTADRQKYLRDLLESKKRAILIDLRKSLSIQATEQGRMGFELLQDDGDKSVDELERHVQASVMGFKSGQLDAIEQALHRLDEGTYGICEECGADIPLQRLSIQPTAAHCVICQERLDRETRRDTLWNEQSEPSPGSIYDLADE